MRTRVANRWTLLLAMLAAVLSIGLMEPSGVPFAKLRLWLYEGEWETLASETAIEARDELGSLYDLWMHLRSPQVSGRGHFGWEKDAIHALRETTWSDLAEDGGRGYRAFNLQVCAPSAFPGAIGYGTETLRCTLSSIDYRPITNLDHRGLPNGDITDACERGGDSISMQPGGWYCELSGAHPGTVGFRLVVPEVVGTRGETVYGNGIRLEDPTSDSLVWLGRPFGGASGDRYDYRIPSFLTDDAQGGLNIFADNIIVAYQTWWDEQCDGPGGDCTPDEQKMFRACNEATDGVIDNRLVYVVHSDFHGNSGDDIVQFGCWASTWERNFIGPVQRGGGQTSCIVSSGSGVTSDSTTYANGGCFQAGHRVPNTHGGRKEVVNWVVSGIDSRPFEFTGASCCHELNIRSALLLPSKVTDGDKHEVWLLVRVNASAGSGTGLILGDIANDSNFYKLDYGKVAIDTLPNDGDFTIHSATYDDPAFEGEEIKSLWSNKPGGWAICDRTSALGGDTFFPCDDANGNTIDSLDFAADSTLHTSDYADVKDGSEIFEDLITNQNVGNRFRIACDGTVTDAHDHNALVDSILSWERQQQLPARIPGSHPDSMQVWFPGYPTATGLAADSATTSYTPCPKNANDVPSAMASRINPGNPGSVTWDDDTDGDGYELWREMVAPSDPTVFTNPDGTEGDGGGTPSGLTWGGGGGLRVRLVDMVLDTFYFAGGDPPADSIPVVIPVTPPQVIPSGIQGRWCYNDAALRAAHITLSSSTEGAPVQDSAAATDTLAAWALPGCLEADIKAAPPGG